MVPIIHLNQKEIGRIQATERKNGCIHEHPVPQTSAPAWQ